MTALAAPDALIERPAQSDDLPTLRFLTCGSVDDGKSTLIGRLLYDHQLILDDQLEHLERDSGKYGTVGDDIDFALLVDGLEAEREQGITIDVAYRYFSTKKRSFIVADTPGHEQYTRNMVTGASNSELAILLVDARKGLLDQTRRHALIASMLGIRHLVLAVNKIDLVGFDQDVFNTIVSDFAQSAGHLDFLSLRAIPISALRGDNVATRSKAMAWYDGACLIDYLERIRVEPGATSPFLRMPVQWVNRPNQEFRGFSGTLASGSVGVGDKVIVTASGRTTQVKRIVTMDGDLERAEAADSVTLVLADELDISRGDVIADPDNRPHYSSQFAAHVIWMGQEDLFPGRSYLLKIGASTVPASVTELRHKIDIHTFETRPAKTLQTNEIGYCNLSTVRPVAFDPYKVNRDMGSFVLIDRYDNSTAAAGLIDFSLRRASNISLQDLSVSRETRALLKHQKPAVIWLTGLSGSGKSTIANLVEVKLAARHAHSTMLDGDNVRHGLNRDLGFTEVDRIENIRRIGEVAKLMTDAGLIVLCSFISPFRADRQFIRELLNAGEFVEVFLDVPVETCAARDPKGLYKRAYAGEIKNFTGVDQAYEKPDAAELTFRDGVSPEDAADAIIAWLIAHDMIL